MGVVSIRLDNFQSHERTQLELGALTVIVGSSSSGKTAVLRALSTLVNNSRGTSYVRSGAKSAQVSASFEGSEPVDDARTHVRVQRGPGMSIYELALPGSDAVRFTKCGTAVPEAVSAALDFGRDGLWLAGQFDTPFLLDVTGSQVARVLGQLTGVSLLFAAVRECNRRASAAKAELRSRRAELEEVAAAAERFRTLSARRAAGERAEEALVAAERLSARRDRLAGLVAELQATSRRVAEVPVSPVSDTVGSALVRAEELAEQYRRLSELIASVRSVRLRVEENRTAALVAQQRESAAREEFRGLLASSEVCPLCGATQEHQHLESVI